MGSAIRAGYGMGSVVTHVSTYCQLPVSQASLLIELSGALAVGGGACCIGMAFVFCNCFGTHPTSTTAAIMISS